MQPFLGGRPVRHVEIGTDNDDIGALGIQKMRGVRFKWPRAGYEERIWRPAQTLPLAAFAIAHAKNLPRYRPPQDSVLPPERRVQEYLTRHIMPLEIVGGNGHANLRDRLAGDRQPTLIDAILAEAVTRYLESPIGDSERAARRVGRRQVQWLKPKFEYIMPTDDQALRRLLGQLGLDALLKELDT